MFRKLTEKYHLKQGKVGNGKNTKVKWEFYDHLNFLKQKPSEDEVCYVNDAFNSAESSEVEDDDTCDDGTRVSGYHPITSSTAAANQLNRKRPYSPASPPKIFQKAAEYMVAELENMERAKAERLLNRTMKFFVDHRYD